MDNLTYKILGKQRYSDVEFSGVLHVNNDEGIDYFGMIVGYQSMKKFFLVLWRHENINFRNETYKAGIKGIQIKKVFLIIIPNYSFEFHPLILYSLLNDKVA